ncbi:hypothetical protein [Streptomyces sp. x-80]|uniref:hypothetical protein n=1 Tax=Streptomyces sp. x-80 TaxID=2789282 RepID=UPI0039812F60
MPPIPGHGRQALDLPSLPKCTEGIRSKLRCLVSWGILAEPEPGLFAHSGALVPGDYCFGAKILR